MDEFIETALNTSGDFGTYQKMGENLSKKGRAAKEQIVLKSLSSKYSSSLDL